MATIEERVIEAIKDQLGLDEDEVDEITRDTKLKENLGADSLDLPELEMELEDRFVVSFGEEQVRALFEGEDTTVGQIIDAVKSALGE
jgi:acyl carrier protein